MHVYFINCFIAKLYRKTLPVAPTVRFMASAAMMWPICYSDTFFQFPPVRDTADCVQQVVAFARLKTIENFKQSSLKVVAYERWSFTRGGRLREVPSIVA